MIKKTLYFGNMARLNVKLRQLQISRPNAINPSVDDITSIPIEDIGIVIFDHNQINFTHAVIDSLIQNNVVVVWCDHKHIPSAMTLPLVSHDTYNERLRYQITASEPLKKQLWKQTIEAKIENQAAVLDLCGKDSLKLKKMIPRIASGDPDNYEGQAAAIYWEQILEDYNVNRGRYEGGPNHYFNYGYAILRSVIARSLVGSGCLLVLGIHHANKYNPYCLADDIMEPYRPIVDWYIIQYLKQLHTFNPELTTDDKKYLLNIPVIDIHFNKIKSPLMVGSQKTTASLAKCYKGDLRKINYPCLAV